MSPQISDFDLIGLSKKKSVTCAVIGGSQEIFWPEVVMAQDRFDAFWNYYSGRSDGQKFLAKIEHNGLNNDGTPNQAKLVEIIDK